MIKEYDTLLQAHDEVRELIMFEAGRIIDRHPGCKPEEGTYEIFNIEFYFNVWEDETGGIAYQPEDVKLYDFANLAEKKGVTFDRSGESESVYFTYLRRNDMFPEDIEEATLRVSQHQNGQLYDHNLICDSLKDMYSNVKLFLNQIPDQKVMKEELNCIK